MEKPKPIKRNKHERLMLVLLTEQYARCGFEGKSLQLQKVT